MPSARSVAILVARFSAGIVEGVRQQSEESSSLDRLHDPRLLLAVGSGSARGVYLTDRVQVADEDVQPLVIDLFNLQLCRELFAVEPCDDILSCIPAGLPNNSNLGACWEVEAKVSERFKLLLRPSSVNGSTYPENALCLPHHAS